MYVCSLELDSDVENCDTFIKDLHPNLLRCTLNLCFQDSCISFSSVLVSLTMMRHSAKRRLKLLVVEWEGCMLTEIMQISHYHSCEV